MAGSWHGRFREDPKSLWPLCLPLSFHEQSGPTAVVLTRVHLRFHGFGNPGADLLVAMLVPSRMECARLFSKIGTQNTLESRSATPVVAAATASGSTTEASKRFPYKARRDDGRHTRKQLHDPAGERGDGCSQEGEAVRSLHEAAGGRGDGPPQGKWGSSLLLSLFRNQIIPEISGPTSRTNDNAY